MITTTWELHIAAPRYPEERSALIEELEFHKHRATELIVDYVADEDQIHVMFDDVKVLRSVMESCRLLRLDDLTLSCSFSGSTLRGPIHGELICGNDEESEIDCPSRH